MWIEFPSLNKHAVHITLYLKLKLLHEIHIGYVYTVEHEQPSHPFPCFCRPEEYITAVAGFVLQ